MCVDWYIEKLSINLFISYKGGAKRFLSRRYEKVQRLHVAGTWKLLACMCFCRDIVHRWELFRVSTLKALFIFFALRRARQSYFRYVVLMTSFLCCDIILYVNRLIVVIVLCLLSKIKFNFKFKDKLSLLISITSLFVYQQFLQLVFKLSFSLSDTIQPATSIGSNLVRENHNHCWVKTKKNNKIN